MGNCAKSDLRVRFDGSLTRKFLVSEVTVDAGLLAYRNLDESSVPARIASGPGPNKKFCLNVSLTKRV